MYSQGHQRHAVNVTVPTEIQLEKTKQETRFLIYYFLNVRDWDGACLPQTIHCRPPLFLIFADNSQHLPFTKGKIVRILKCKKKIEIVI